MSLFVVISEMDKAEDKLLTSLMNTTASGRSRVYSQSRPNVGKISAVRPPRQRSFYFGLASDIRLLNYVLEANPFENRDAWSAIVSKLHNEGFICSERQCRDRLRLLITTLKQNNMDSINKMTGTKEDWEDRARLIGNVITAKEVAESPWITPDTPDSNSQSTMNEAQSSSQDCRQETQTLELGPITQENISLNENEQVPETRMEVMELDETRFDCDVSSTSPLIDDIVSKRLLKKRRREKSCENDLLRKTKLDHELAMAKIHADREDKKHTHELDLKYLELKEKLLVMEDEDRKRQADICELKLREVAETSKRESKWHEESMRLQKSLIDMLAICIANSNSPSMT